MLLGLVPSLALASMRVNYALAIDFPGGATKATLVPFFKKLIEGWAETHKAASIVGDVEIVLQDGADRPLASGTYPPSQVFGMKDYEAPLRLAVSQKVDIKSVISLIVQFTAAG